MKMKAIVTKLDINRGVMVVLTKDRQFKSLQVPDPLPHLGDKVDIDTTNRSLPWLRLVKSGWIAAAVAAIVLVTGLLGYSQVSSASTYITLDMKSSLQVALDGRGRVKSVRPLNKSGQELIKKLNLDEKDVYTAIEEIMYGASRSGDLHSRQDNLVVAGIARGNGDNQFNIDIKKLRAVIHDEMSANHNPGYIVINNLKTTVRDSGESELSANKLMLLERAGQSGVTLKPETVKEMDMMEIVKKCNSSVPKLFPENSYQVSWQNETVKTGGSDSKSGNGGSPPAPNKAPDTGGMHRDAGSGIPGNMPSKPSHMPMPIQDGESVNEGGGMMQGMPR